MSLLSAGVRVAREAGRLLVRRVLLDALRDPAGRAVLGPALLDVVGAHPAPFDAARVGGVARRVARDLLGEILDGAEAIHRAQWPVCACAAPVPGEVATRICSTCNRVLPSESGWFSPTAAQLREAIERNARGVA